eukprot:jgi/Tetstr1/447043/TSEL_003671.t1
MSSRGSPTAPKMVDVGKAAALGGVGTTATEADFIEAARRKAEDIGMKQLIQDKLCRFFTTQETPMPPAADGEEDTIPGGNESRAGGQDQNGSAHSALSSERHYLDRKTALATALPGFENGMPPDSLRRPGLFPIALDRVFDYMLGNPRLQPAANGYYHAACYGAFIACSTIELPHWGTQMPHGDTFALDVVREHYLRLATENLRSPEFSELLELHKDRVYDANIASAAKTTARQRSGGALLRRNDSDRDGGGGSRENF